MTKKPNQFFYAIADQAVARIHSADGVVITTRDVLAEEFEMCFTKALDRASSWALEATEDFGVAIRRKILEAKPE